MTNSQEELVGHLTNCLQKKLLPVVAFGKFCRQSNPYLGFADKKFSAVAQKKFGAATGEVQMTFANCIYLQKNAKWRPDNLQRTLRCFMHKQKQLAQCSGVHQKFG